MKPYAKILLIIKTVVLWIALPIGLFYALEYDNYILFLIISAVALLMVGGYDLIRKARPSDFGRDSEAFGKKADPYSWVPIAVYFMLIVLRDIWK